MANCARDECAYALGKPTQQVSNISDYPTLVCIHPIHTVDNKPFPYSSNRSTSREVLCDGFLCPPCFLWVCGAERIENAVGSNGCEVGIRRSVCKDKGEKLQSISVCAP